MSHAVPNQRLLALDDVSLDAPVVISPLPEDTENNSVTRLTPSGEELTFLHHLNHKDVALLMLKPPVENQ